MQPVNDGVVIVTGGGAGIGRGACEALADAGYVVAAVGRRVDKLRDYATDGRVVGFGCDVREPEEVGSVVAEISSSLGPIRGLVNSAGILTRGPFDGVTIAQIRDLFETNVEGTVLMIQHCLNDLKATRGSIVNLSSMLTRRPFADVTAYCITKGAIEALSMALARELAPHGIRVHVVLPSLVRSDIYIDQGMPPADYERMLDSATSMFPLGRVGEPEDVASIIRFLVSDESSWMTGCMINVDGGRGIA